MNPQNANNNSTNPLSDLISDSIYNVLKSRNLINEKSVRDYLIKQNFRRMRQQKTSATTAINIIRKEHPYLQFDTIRKIVYQIDK